MNIICSYAGFHDPYYFDGTCGQEMQGPLLHALSAQPCDLLALFNTPLTRGHTESTLTVLQEKFPHIQCRVLEMPVWLTYQDSHTATLNAMREECIKLVEEFPEASFYVNILSSPPEAHPIWYLLAYSGCLPCVVIYVRPENVMLTDWPRIERVDTTTHSFCINIANSPSPQKSTGAPPAQKYDYPNHRALARQMGLAGEHKLFRFTLETAALLAAADLPILLLGESGTGKDLFAKYIHAMSLRPGSRFTVINCAALPESLAESILFGHRKGAFTGADSHQPGKFVQADGGTLFLDEIGELPLVIQAKLLRILEDGVVESLGGREPQRVNVRIIAATNREIPRMVETGTFREDLYFRLSAGFLSIPPLRERRSDIPILCRILLERINTILRTPKSLPKETLHLLESLDMPGNVRTLKNILERSARLCKHTTIKPEDLYFPAEVKATALPRALPDLTSDFNLNEYLQELRIEIVKKAVSESLNKSQASRKLGITPQALSQYLLRKTE